MRAPNDLPRRPRVNGGILLLLVFVLMPALCLLQGWWIMVLWGALAPKFGAATIGYGTAVLVGLALGCVGSFFRAAKT